ncbi:MAG TPA: fluoride efflux transporter CrcB [Alphaproteobacteria bacterium]|nr:fluoride efflux transporter CrcB [Alphaproteobacteria bacterium]
MQAAIWVTIGAAIGGMARFWISGFVARRMGETFPWGTLLVNISGSFVIGLATTLGGPGADVMGGPTVRLFLTTGICGGYTTFSSFSLQTLNLAREGEWGAVAGNVLFSVVLCILAAYLGVLAGTALTPR